MSESREKFPKFNEPIPPSRENLQFPGGDISEDDLIVAAEKLEELNLGNQDTRREKRQLMCRQELSLMTSDPTQQQNYRRLGSLVECWGTSYCRGLDRPEKLARFGLQYTFAFARQARILPRVKLIDLRDIIDESAERERPDRPNLALYDPEMISEFNCESWNAMYVSHPRLYKALDAWVGFLEDEFNVTEDDEMVELLGASCALPYVLTAHTRMNGYLSMDQIQNYANSPK